MAKANSGKQPPNSGKQPPNSGKQFERHFKDSAIKQELCVLRLNDVYLGNQKSGADWSPTNPCDFVIYYAGKMFMLELKSTCYKSISISLDPKENRMIKAHQIRDLSKYSLFDGVYCGFVFNFREENDDLTYFMSIQDFNDFIDKTGKASINKLDIVENGGFLIEEKKCRKYYAYNVKKLLEDLT